MSVKANLQDIQTKVEQACEKSNRDPDEITIIGVTKYVTMERTNEMIAAGITNIGENRADELEEKYQHIGNQAHWHFIGSLQSRKTKDIIDKVSAIHSLDRMSLVKQIHNRAQAPMDCFIQVNVSGEQSKHGLAPHEVLPFIENIKGYDNVRIVGLMTMAPHTKDEEVLRSVFQELALLKNEIQNKNINYAPCLYLSMGMSNDYEIAIEEGATHIRLGSKLVGSNKK